MTNATKESAGMQGTFAGNRTMVLLLGAGVVVAAAAIALAVWVTRPDTAPRLNADTVTLASFVATEQYIKLPFDRQQMYMKVLEEREDNDELERAFESGRINEATYRAAIQEAWLGEQLKRAERYAVLAPGAERTRFIADLLAKKQKSKSPGGSSPGARPGSSSSDSDGGDADLIKRDDAVSQARVATWPLPVREQFEAFRRDYEQAKDARDAAKAASAPPSE